MQVVDFKPGPRDRARKAFASFWAWLVRILPHRHHWEDELKANVLNSKNDLLGHKYVQKCSAPGCGRRRFWEDF